MTNPLALTHASAAARLEVRRVAAAQLEPDMPLAGYLQPLQNLTAAIVSSASTAARLADLAILTIIDPEVADDADGDLKKAERRARQAGDQTSHTFDEIRRALRAGGRAVPYLGGLDRPRRYKTTADALAALSAEAEKVVCTFPPPHLGYVKDPAVDLADILDQLGKTTGKLRAGIGDASTPLAPDAARKVGRATDRLAQSVAYLERACGYATWGAGTVADAINTQRTVSAR